MGDLHGVFRRMDVALLNSGSQTIQANVQNMPGGRKRDYSIWMKYVPIIYSLEVSVLRSLPSRVIRYVCLLVCWGHSTSILIVTVSNRTIVTNYRHILFILYKRKKSSSQSSSGFHCE